MGERILCYSLGDDEDGNEICVVSADEFVKLKKEVITLQAQLLELSGIVAVLANRLGHDAVEILRANQSRGRRAA